MKTRKIGIIGSRGRNSKIDYADVLKAFLKIYKEGDTIISGGCPKEGDHFAEIIATTLKIPIKIYPANWKLGRHAGFLRNTKIAENSEILIACVSNDRIGGTEDTIKKFLKFNTKDDLVLV